jgi:hypothetical protein
MKDSHGLTQWEMRAFLATSTLAGSFLALLAWFLVPALLAHVLGLPQAAAQAAGAGLAFLLLFWTLYPALRTQARLDESPGVLPFKRYVLSSLLGLVVAALVVFGLRAAGLEPY